MGGIYEVDKNSGGSVTGTKTYYPAAGAMRDGSTLYYVLKDHLGSASVLTSNTGALITGADTRYYPFGEARFSTSSMITDKLFTGQREITGLGIYHYGARFYSPKLGRFLSADTIVPGYANPQNLNRYSYVINNPLRYIDPTGHRACEDGDGQGSCLSEKQVTKKYKADLQARKKKSRNKDDGGGGQPLLSPDPNASNILASPTAQHSCSSDPNCFYASEAELNNGITGLTILRDGLAVESGIYFLVAGMTLGAPPIAFTAAVIGAELIVDSNEASDTKSYLNAARDAAHNNGGVIEIHKTESLLSTSYNHNGASAPESVAWPLTRIVMEAFSWLSSLNDAP